MVLAEEPIDLKVARLHKTFIHCTLIVNLHLPYKSWREDSNVERPEEGKFLAKMFVLLSFKQERIFWLKQKPNEALSLLFSVSVTAILQFTAKIPV